MSHVKVMFSQAEHKHTFADTHNLQKIKQNESLSQTDSSSQSLTLQSTWREEISLCSGVERQKKRKEETKTTTSRKEVSLKKNLCCKWPTFDSPRANGELIQQTFTRIFFPFQLPPKPPRNEWTWWCVSECVISQYLLAAVSSLWETEVSQSD